MKKRLLVGLLVASFALRVALDIRGGQNFWPDESRYGSAVEAAGDIGHSRWGHAFAELFGHADHIFFRPAAFPAAMAEYGLGGQHLILDSCYFSLFSVGAIFLVWAIARRAGASETEALWSAFLAATANCLFFYSRHFLPYDIALFVLLGALWLAIGPNSVWRSLGVGCVVGLGILVYNGYWLLGAAVIALQTSFRDGGRQRILARLAASGFGAGLTIACGIGIGAAVSSELLISLRGFAASVRQGDFYVGYKVIPEYLWYSERGMLIVWLSAMAYAAATAFRTPKSGRPPWWLWGLAFVTGGLIFFSDIVPRFMVYGRLTRQMVPFICLGAGAGIAQFLEARRNLKAPLGGMLFALVVYLAAWNFSAPLRLVFPDDFLRMARQEIPKQAGAGYGFYQILYAETLWGKPIGRDIPPHADLLRSPNPMQFRPYQFEGYSAAQRQELNHSDISMRVIRFPSQFSKLNSLWDGYPGPVSMTVSFRPEFWGLSEPIAVSGIAGRGDVVLVRYSDRDHLQFGLDHWGSPEILSEPIKTDFARPHSLLISAGNLVPPQGSAFYTTHPEYAGLWDQLVVALDGHVVLSKRAQFFPSTPSSIFFGTSIIGGTATRPNFTGTVSDFKTAGIDDFGGAIPSLVNREVLRKRSPDWRGALGPLRITFRMPASSGEQAVGQPLLSFGDSASGAVLYAVHAGAGMIRIGFDRKNRPQLISDPMPLSAAGADVLDVCSGALLPAAGASIYARVPGLERMRDVLYVHLNGAPALQLDAPFQPVAAERTALWANAVGSSACADLFRGDLMSVEAIGPECLLPLGSRLSDLLVNLDEGWGGYTGPVRMRLRLPAGRGGQTEPLLVSGSRGSSDIVSVSYEADSRIRFRYTQSDGPELESLPIEIVPDTPHELLLSVGTLMPPDGSGIYRETPEFSQFHAIVDVAVDGHPALFFLREPHPAKREQIFVGKNPFAAGGAGPAFSGIVEALTRASPAELLATSAVGAALARPGWDGYPGPLQMKIIFPSGTDGEGQPILTTGFPGGGDFVLLQFGPNGTGRIVEDHWGEPLLRSEPFPLVPGSEHRLSVSFGALCPPEGAALYGREPQLAALRKAVVVELDGRRIITAARASHPTPPERIIVGANYIGGSYTGAIFSGRISDLARSAVGPVAP